MKNKKSITAELSYISGLIWPKHGIMYERPKQPRKISVSSIKKAVCRYYGLTDLDLSGGRRFKGLVRARHIAVCLILQHVPGATNDFAGKSVGIMDQSTVIDVLRSVSDQLESYASYRSDFYAIFDTAILIELEESGEKSIFDFPEYFRMKKQA